ncbi:MAG: ATP-binding cassette domain-containing protein, partial [Mucilaginibacter sp.]
MIEVERLSKYFGDIKAVDGISFEVKERETLVLLGTSGCGKTTTLKMINRLIEPTSGTITIDGKTIFDQSPEILRRGIGYVLQNNGLFPHYTVAEN